MSVVGPGGLQIKTIEQLVAEMSARMREDIDEGLITSVDRPEGQLIGVIAGQLRELWELGALAYHAFNPNAAEKILLDHICAITGTRRLGATRGTVLLTCNLDNGTTLEAGNAYAHTNDKPDERWTPIEDFTATSTGNHDIWFEAENAGKILANAGTIQTIATPVTGWNSVNNVEDVIPGKEIDTDPELRLRRVDEIRVSGSATLPAIRADILIDDQVYQVSIFENKSDYTDPVTGIPGHSIEAVVFDGTPPQLTNDEIAQLIFNTKGGGTGTYGTESGIAVDETGQTHSINFSRPVEREVYVDLWISIDELTGYAGQDAVKAALVELNTSDLQQGRDVIVNRIREVAMSFDGIFDLTQPPRIGFISSPPNSINLIIGNREIARLDTGRINIIEFYGPLP